MHVLCVLTYPGINGKNCKSKKWLVCGELNRKVLYGWWNIRIIKDVQESKSSSMSEQWHRWISREVESKTGLFYINIGNLISVDDGAAYKKW